MKEHRLSDAKTDEFFELKRLLFIAQDKKISFNISEMNSEDHFD